jgi:hypothetical protein
MKNQTSCNKGFPIRGIKSTFPETPISYEAKKKRKKTTRFAAQNAGKDDLV